MARSTRRRISGVQTTFLDLVAAVAEASGSDAETVAVVADWMAAGRVRQVVAAARPFARVPSRGAPGAR